MPLAAVVPAAAAAIAYLLAAAVIACLLACLLLLPLSAAAHCFCLPLLHAAAAAIRLLQVASYCNCYNYSAASLKLLQA